MTAQPLRLAREVPAAAARCRLLRILRHRVGARHHLATRAGRASAAWRKWVALRESQIGVARRLSLRPGGAHNGFGLFLWFCACKLPLRLQDRRRCGTRWAVRYPGNPFQVGAGVLCVPQSCQDPFFCRAVLSGHENSEWPHGATQGVLRAQSAAGLLESAVAACFFFSMFFAVFSLPQWPGGKRLRQDHRPLPPTACDMFCFRATLQRLHWHLHLPYMLA